MSGRAGFRPIAEREIHRGHVITVVETTVATPDGDEIVRDVVRHPGAVSVVPVDGDEVVLVRQYRAAVDAELLEIPAGKRDVAGEAPAITAARELEEEVGLRAGRLEPLCRFFNSVGFCDEESHVFLATELSAATADPQGPEESWMSVERVALDEVAAMIAAGEIVDAKTVIGLLATLRRLGR